MKLVELKYLFTAGDEISYYKTVKFEKKSVFEYVKEILSDTKEWGYINLFDWDTHQEDRIEYSHGTIIFEAKNDWSNKIVTGVEYSGGWSRGDWKIETGDKGELNGIYSK